MEKLEDNELIVLSKILNYIKFGCEEYECKYFAGSPIVGELYKKVTESLHDYYKKKGGVEVDEKWPFIEEMPHYLKTINNHIKNTENWQDISMETKREFIRTLIYPYRYLETTIDNLIKGVE